MNSHIQKVFAVAFMSIGFVSLARADQTAPKDILPPAVQKSTVSPTLTVTTPSNVSELSPYRTAVTPQVPAAPVQSIPALPLPARVETNAVPAPNTSQPVSPSPWNGTNSSAWGKSTTSAAAPPPTMKAPADPWSTSPAGSHTWDSAVPVNSGTKTEWK